MGFIRQRHEYLFEKYTTHAPSKLSDVYTTVKQSLSKHLGILGEYNAEWDVKKADGQKLKGKLFRTLDGKGIRFNWKNTDKVANIISIDLWKEVSLGGKTAYINKPDHTIELNGSPISSVTKNIISYFDGVHNELINNDINSGPAQSEEANPEDIPVSLVGMDEEEMGSMEMDIFEVIKFRVFQTAYGYANSLIITGQSGVGKTFDVMKALKETNKEYKFVKGDISTSGLYQLLFERHNQFIVFDDCDSVFEDRNSVNILKAALDSYPEREVSRPIFTHFSTVGMTMDDIMANYTGNRELAKNKHLFKIENKGKLPQSFIFTGRIIFISNLKKDELDPTLITRSSAHIDIDLTHDEILDRMKKVMSQISVTVPMEKKEEVLGLIDYLTTHYETRHPLSIRALVNAINTRISNEMLVSIGGKKIPMWQLLIKKDMLYKNAKRKQVG